MPLTEAIELGSVTIGEFGHLSVRVDTVIYDGKTERSRQPWRVGLAPGDDLAKVQDPRFVAVKARIAEIAAGAWTPAVLTQYAALKAALTAQQEG